MGRWLLESPVHFWCRHGIRSDQCDQTCKLDKQCCATVHTYIKSLYSSVRTTWVHIKKMKYKRKSRYHGPASNFRLNITRRWIYAPFDGRHISYPFIPHLGGGGAIYVLRIIRITINNKTKYQFFCNQRCIFTSWITSSRHYKVKEVSDIIAT